MILPSRLVIAKGFPHITSFEVIHTHFTILSYSHTLRTFELFAHTLHS
jgi:hypothetical protein